MEIPQSWGALSPAQLEYVCALLAQECYTPQEIAAYFLLRHCLTDDERRVLGSWRGVSDNEDAIATLAAHSGWLRWMEQPPTTPVRLPVLDGAHAVAANLDGLSFGDYLKCENLYQGFLSSQNMEALAQMLPLLYRTEDGDYAVDVEATPARCYSVLLWWMSVKPLLSTLYPRLFVAAGGGDEFGDDAPMAQQQRESTNAQIRALTDGDVTKEPQVLATDVHRALTELDAKIRDAAHLKSQSQ